MKTYTIICIIATVMCGCRQETATSGRIVREFALCLPEIDLRPGERVSALRMNIAGGEAGTIHRPCDWFVSAGPSENGECAIVCEANHGLYWLTDKRPLDQAVSVITDDPKQVRIEGVVEVSRVDGERDISLTPEQIALVPLSSLR